MKIILQHTILTISVNGSNVVDREICVVVICFLIVSGMNLVTFAGRRDIILEKIPLNACDTRYRRPRGPLPGSWSSFHRARPSGTYRDEEVMV